jgi:KDO2-lipid IV(A) lauroyltransferase
LTAQKLFELRDLYRLPAWVVAKPLYALAPISLHFRLATLKGTFESLVSPRRNATLAALERHLGEECSPAEARRVARRHFQFRRRERLARLWPQIRGFAGVEAIEVEGLEHLDDALAAGKGAILVTAHFGHGRLIKPILRSRGREALVIGHVNPERHDIPPLYTRFGNLVHTRLLRLPRASRFDERWLATVGEDLAASLNLRPHLAALAQNKVLLAPADGRAWAPRRIPVLGVDAYFASGAVSVARATGAPALPAFVVDEPRRGDPIGLRLVIHRPLDLQLSRDANDDHDVNLRRFAAVFEEQIRANPHNWQWTWVNGGVLKDRRKKR